jgi:hypothetical protein
MDDGSIHPEAEWRDNGSGRGPSAQNKNVVPHLSLSLVRARTFMSSQVGFLCHSRSDYVGRKTQLTLVGKVTNGFYSCSEQAAKSWKGSAVQFLGVVEMLNVICASRGQSL